MIFSHANTYEVFSKSPTPHQIARGLASMRPKSWSSNSFSGFTNGPQLHREPYQRTIEYIPGPVYEESRHWTQPFAGTEYDMMQMISDETQPTTPDIMFHALREDHTHDQLWNEGQAKQEIEDAIWEERLQSDQHQTADAYEIDLNIHMAQAGFGQPDEISPQYEMQDSYQSQGPDLEQRVEDTLHPYTSYQQPDPYDPLQHLSGSQQINPFAPLNPFGPIGPGM